MRFCPDGREFLIELMEENHISHRQLAQIADWRAHSYVGRLLDPDDHKAKTVSVEAGIRIAKYFGVKPHRLFLIDTSLDVGQIDPSTETDGRVRSKSCKQKTSKRIGHSVRQSRRNGQPA